MRQPPMGVVTIHDHIRRDSSGAWYIGPVRGPYELFSGERFGGAAAAMRKTPGGASCRGVCPVQVGLRGPESGCEALPGSRSGWLVLRVDAVLPEQGPDPLDRVGELLDPLGQIREGRVPGGPLLLPRGLAGQQFLLPI